MGDLQWYDYLRFATCLLALGSVYVSASRAVKSWNRYTDRLRGLWWALNALLLLLVEGTIEQVITNANWGPRVLLAFIVALGCFLSVRREEGYIKTD